MAGGSIPGCIGSRIVGVIDIFTYFLSLVWYTRVILTAPQPWDLTDFESFRFVIAFYFIMAFAASILLIYATYPCASLHLRKQLGTFWSAFRGLSIIIAIYLLLFSRQFGYDKSWCLITAAGFITFWAVACYVVMIYVVGLKAAIGEEYRPPLVRKRKVSSVAILDEEAEAEPSCGTTSGMTQIHTRQLQQFQAYVQQTSWCNDRHGKSGNRLNVPESTF